MSKRNLLLGTASGKVGDLVFYRSKGEQKTRGYVIPTDAKTYSQVVSRMKMLNPVSAFRAMKPMIVNNFLGKKANQSDFNAFVSANKSKSPFFISNADLSANACIPFGLQVSSGHDGVVLQPRFASIGNAFEKNDPATYGLVIASGFNFRDFHVLGGKVSSSGVQFLSDDEIFDFVKGYFNCSIPAGFTVHVMTCDYGLDTDNGTDVWQPFVLSRCYNATGDCTRVKWGHEPAYRFASGESLGYTSIAEDFAAIGIVASENLIMDSDDAGNTTGGKIHAGLALAVGRPSITLGDYGARAAAVVLEWDAADGHHVTTSFVNNPTWAVNGETERTPEVVAQALDEFYLTDFLYGGLYFDQCLEDHPYKGQIQPVNYPSVVLDDMLYLVPEFQVNEDEAS